MHGLPLELSLIKKKKKRKENTQKPFKILLERDFNKKYQTNKSTVYIIAGFSTTLFDICIRDMNGVLLYYAS